MEYQRLVVLDLTKETHGNGLGIGLADITTKKVANKMDYRQAYMNAFTSKIVMSAVKMPMTLDSDREAIGVALKSCIGVNAGTHKVVRIKNTLAVQEFEISDTLIDEAKQLSNLEIISNPVEMRFDKNGNII